MFPGKHYICKFYCTQAIILWEAYQAVFLGREVCEQLIKHHYLASVSGIPKLTIMDPSQLIYFIWC